MQDRAHLEHEDSEAVTPSRRKPLPVLALLALAAAAVFAWHQHAQHGATVHARGAASAGAAQLQMQMQMHLADFRQDQPSPDARLMANWVAATGDNHGRAFIIVDKKDARVYVFTPQGRL